MTASSLVIPALSDACLCADCRYPKATNAGERAWHTLCHREFLELMSPPPALSMREVESRATGVCKLPHHGMLPRHPAHH